MRFDLGSNRYLTQGQIAVRMGPNRVSFGLIEPKPRAEAPEKLDAEGTEHRVVAFVAAEASDDVSL